MKKLLTLLALVGLGGGAYWYFIKRVPGSTSSGGAMDFLLNVMGGATRGLRNNNPGNIKWNSVNNWVGQTGKDAEGFAIFDRPENGIRAMNKNLNTYATTGRNTARKIVESWTYGDSPTIQSNYMLKIEQLTGKNRDIILGAADRLALIKAIILFENANQNPFSDAFILGAMAL